MVRATKEYTEWNGHDHIRRYASVILDIYRDGHVRVRLIAGSKYVVMGMPPAEMNVHVPDAEKSASLEDLLHRLNRTLAAGGIDTDLRADDKPAWPLLSLADLAPIARRLPGLPVCLPGPDEV